MVKSPFLPVIAPGPCGDLRYPSSLRFTYSRKHMIRHLLFVYCTHAMQHPNFGITRLTTGILKWSEMPHCATNRLVLQSNTNKYLDLLISSRLAWGFNTVPTVGLGLYILKTHHSTLITNVQRPKPSFWFLDITRGQWCSLPYQSQQVLHFHSWDGPVAWKPKHSRDG